ncbi:hypothetical protein LB503_011556 [Fusarium chuoi]|nr:hypothetical protein LB503_011556 [Fusarium chuoi]
MFKELAWYRNECDVFLKNDPVDDGEVRWGPVPDFEGGALLNGFYAKSSKVTSANNTGERTNQPHAPVSPSSKDTTANGQASREESSLFVDDQNGDQGDQSCAIKSEDDDNSQQALSGLPQSTKRASDSEGRARRGGKRQRTK